MDMSGRIIRVQDKFFDIDRAEMKHASFPVIDPDRSMVMMFGHGIPRFLPIR
jgi:hypothetical protein